jgi:hypothetical protein
VIEDCELDELAGQFYKAGKFCKEGISCLSLNKLKPEFWAAYIKPSSSVVHIFANRTPILETYEGESLLEKNGISTTY